MTSTHFHTIDSETLQAVRHMAGSLKRDGSFRYSVEYIANYHGIATAQVERIRRNLPKYSRRECPRVMP